MRALRFIGLGLAGTVLLGFVPPAYSAQATFTGVARSIDGDSLYVGDREVRLFGIDAPEYHQSCTRDGKPWACGADAAKQLSSLVTGKQVRCDQVDTDEHGRIVARCTAGSVDVNRVMVATGYATAYRHYSMDYVRAEEIAKANKRGLWAGMFEMPSEYRHAREVQIAPQRSTARHAPGSQSRPTVNAPSSCKIKGNRGKHGWIYHVPGMPYYEQTRAEEIFCTEREAQAAGYRRARAQ